MPVQSCRSEGKPGYRWGESGKCYTYTPGDDASRERAKDKAARQGRAIQVNKDNNSLLDYINKLNKRIEELEKKISNVKNVKNREREK